MPKWVDDAEDQLVADLNAGNIDRATFDREMRSLHNELRGMAEDAAQDAYDNAYYS